jgi:O-antigen ligase
MSDSSTYYRFHTWLGSFDMLGDHLFGGIGFGSSAFERVYPQYAHAGIESAEHSHNLFLQITVMMGVVGLAVFLAVLLLFAQKNLEYYKNAKASGSYSGVAVAAFCSVMCAIVMGMFDYIWYNNRIFFLFWAVIGISCAAVRISDSLAERTENEIVFDRKSAFIDI